MVLPIHRRGKLNGIFLKLTDFSFRQYSHFLPTLGIEVVWFASRFRVGWNTGSSVPLGSTNCCQTGGVVP